VSAVVARKRRMREAVSTLLGATGRNRGKAIASLTQTISAVQCGVEALRRLQECERVLNRAKNGNGMTAKRITEQLEYALEGEWA
jgi:hypothetical protein